MFKRTTIGNLCATNLMINNFCCNRKMFGKVHSAFLHWPLYNIYLFSNMKASAWYHHIICLQSTVHPYQLNQQQRVIGVFQTTLITRFIIRPYAASAIYLFWQQSNPFTAFILCTTLYHSFPNKLVVKLHDTKMIDKLVINHFTMK